MINARSTKYVLVKFGFLLSILGQALFIFSNTIVNVYASENTDIIETITEENYTETMKSLVEPYLESRLESGYIREQNDIDLYYEKYTIDNAKANIVISHGFAENLEKYHEVIYYFLRSGYNVFAVEHRGHGKSGNLGIQDSSQMNVESFDEYITDFKCFLDKVVVPNNKNKKMFLYSHSLGSLIGTAILEEYPEYFDSAIFSSPMMQLNTGLVPDFIAKLIVDVAVRLQYDDEYVLGQKPYAEETSKSLNTTSSLERYNYINDIIKNNKIYQKGGVSYQWLYEAFSTIEDIYKPEKIKKIDIPILLFQAEDDTYVNSKGQNEFDKYAKNCELINIKDSKHEIYIESDIIQKPYFEKVLDFYQRNL